MEINYKSVSVRPMGLTASQGSPWKDLKDVGVWGLGLGIG